MLISSSDPVRERLRRQLANHAYPGYVYGYPHKKAYRTLETPRSLAEAWADEPRHALFCYVHIPFCNQRCSFCNLFTCVPGDADPASAYLDALEREMAAYARDLGSANFRRLYLGGGTPTFLEAGALRRLVRSLRDTLGVDPARTGACIEASPETLDEEKVGVLRDLGFQRLSLGVQSFVPEELRQVNRRFDFGQHARALEWVGRAAFPHFNVDLIYGLPGQTRDSWRSSLEAAVASPATSLFLYPLYIRPLTGLDRRAEQLPCPTPHEMGELYDLAVVMLADAGFRQVTMRQFLRPSSSAACGFAPASDDLEYRCQQDGMVGLGAGARSYTRRLHYSTPWRMVGRNIRAVVDEYAGRMREGDTRIRHGFVLDAEEEQRRFTILSLLFDGLDPEAFTEAFGADVRSVFADEWEALGEEGLVEETLFGRSRRSALRLTPRGVRHADIVGQLFFSPRVRDLMDTYEYDT